MRCTNTPNVMTTKILITQNEWHAFRLLAQSKSLKVQGYLGQLIKRELANAEESGDAGR